MGVLKVFKQWICKHDYERAYDEGLPVHTRVYQCSKCSKFREICKFASDNFEIRNMSYEEERIDLGSGQVPPREIDCPKCYKILSYKNGYKCPICKIELVFYAPTEEERRT